MPLTIVLGWRGDGKTYFTVEITYHSRRPIFSNFYINHPNYNSFELINILNLPPHIELIMDEGYQMIDSRISMSYVNILASHIAFQLRKTDTNIFVTMQQLMTIDKRYRNEWDYIVECARLPNEEDDWHFWDFIYTIHDKRKQISSNWSILYKDAKRLFEKYDTNEIIEPRNKSRLEYEIYRSKPRILVNRAENIYKKIKDSMIRKTKDGLEHALMKNGFDPIWTKICYVIHKIQ